MMLDTIVAGTRRALDFSLFNAAHETIFADQFRAAV